MRVEHFRPDVARLSAHETSGAAESAHTPAQIGRRVLLVEDDRRLRDMLLDAIRDMGLEPTGAASAEAALRLLAQAPFAIVVLDLNLPGISGMDFCQSVHDRWPHAQAIILTGFGDFESARRAIRLNVTDFLIKPCSMGDLEAALSRARHRWMDKSLQEITQDVIGESSPPGPIAAGAAPADFIAQEAVSMEDVERNTILAALARHRGNRAVAAAELHISQRKLYYRLRQYAQQGLLPGE